MEARPIGRLVLSAPAARRGWTETVRRSLLRWVAIAGCTTLLVVASLLLVRRLSGALQQALPGFALLLLGVALSAGVVALRMLWQAGGSRWPTWSRRAAFAVPGLGALVMAVALSLPGSSLPGLLGLWIVVVAAEAVWWTLELAPTFTHFRASTGSNRDAQRTREVQPLPAGLTRVEQGGAETLAEEASEELDEETLLEDDVVQQITRSRLADGREAVSALVRCDFERAQRMQTVQLAFCPPLAQTPTLECHQLEGLPATLKPALVQTFGVRLDVRLSETASGSCTLILHITATG